MQSEADVEAKCNRKMEAMFLEVEEVLNATTAQHEQVKLGGGCAVDGLGVRDAGCYSGHDDETQCMDIID